MAETVSVALVIPALGPPEDAHFQRHADLARLTPRQALGMHRLKIWLNEQGHTLAPTRSRSLPKNVTTGAEAVRWLLEQLGGA